MVINVEQSGTDTFSALSQDQDFSISNLEKKLLLGMIRKSTIIRQCFCFMLFVDFF